MNAERLGIVTSLIVHGGLLAVLFLVPVTQMIPKMQTIQIRFEEPATLSEHPGTVTAAADRAKRPSHPLVVGQTAPTKPVRKQREYSPQSSAAAPHPTKAAVGVLRDEKPGPVIVQHAGSGPAIAAGNTGAARAGTTGAPKGAPQGVAVTNFGNPSAPSFLHREQPVYPLMARRLGKEGKVTLILLIDASGKLRDIEVAERAGYGFTEAAIEAVKKSTYAPALRNGERVTSKAILPVRFHLQ